MKGLIQLSLLLLLISSATAQEPSPQSSPPQESQKILRDYDWQDLARQQTLPGEVILTNGSSILKFESTNDLLQEISLLRISDPALIKKVYFVVGDLKYENVSGNNPSFLRLSCSVPAVLGAESRTIRAASTPTESARIHGTSNWKYFRFAVVRDALEGLPTQFDLKLVMQGRGTVYLRPIRLYGVAGSWWSPEQSGLIGGIGGSVIGCFGALIGILVSKGKARNFVLTSIKASIVLGILLTIAGVVAVVSSQPYAIWYALLLPGGILTLVFSLNLPSIQRRYDELEIRRMTSVDTMGS